MTEPIITSILDSDLYKFSMQQCVFHQYPSSKVVYEFICRNKDVRLGYLADSIKEEIAQWEFLRLINEERNYLLNGIPYLSRDYVDYLSDYRFNPDNVDVSVDSDGHLHMFIKGYWRDTILFEVPLLATVNELHFRHVSDFRSIQGRGITNLKDKMNMLRSHPRMLISEFGTRRRYSKAWQRYVFNELLRNCPQVIGTSNVRLAMDNNTKPIGTMAHEYISAHLALVDNIRQAQKRSLHVWQQEYDENLGIALTDTFTSTAFFEDFDKTLTRSFAGVRHDSGDPIEFGWKAIEHYKKMGVDPRTKVIVFSDGLDIPKAISIFETFTGVIGVSFGIGTNLTNDLGVSALNIVIKLIECNGKSVVKLSDNAGKHIGDKGVIEKVKMVYGL